MWRPLSNPLPSSCDCQCVSTVCVHIALIIRGRSHQGDVTFYRHRQLPMSHGAYRLREIHRRHMIVHGLFTLCSHALLCAMFTVLLKRFLIILPFCKKGFLIILETSHKLLTRAAQPCEKNKMKVDMPNFFTKQVSCVSLCIKQWTCDCQLSRSAAWNEEKKL